MDLTEYDVKPVEMVNYLRYYGPHFSKRLCKFAVSKMQSKVGFVPYSKDELNEILEKNNISIKDKDSYDYLYVANMCKADFLNSSIIDERHLGLFVKDYLEDIDGYEGIAFNRWLSDIAKKGIIVDWEAMM